MEEDCDECEEWEEHRYWEHADAKGKVFFRVMIDDFSQSLRLPMKFANHLKELSEIVCLKDPSEIKWHIELTKTVDGVFLRSGWKKFAEAHALKENDLLIFEYDGNSCFKIKILEGSGCEKAHSYCLKIKDSLKQGRREGLNVPHCEKIVISGSSGSSDDNILLEKQVSSPPGMSGVTRSSYKRRIFKINEVSGYTRNDGETTSKSVEAKKYVRYPIMKGPADSDDYDKLSDQRICKPRKIRLTSEEEKRASRLARTVCLGNPYFIAVMRPSSIGKSYFLGVPRSFWMAHLPLEMSSLSCYVSLQVAGMSKKWSVKYVARNNMCGMHGFSSNWKRFVLDNGLAEGDICLFELIDNRSGNLEMKVRISRAPVRTRFR